MPQRLNNKDVYALVPEAKGWRNGENVRLDEWIWATGNYCHMIAYGELFWPDFIEHDNCILRYGFSNDSYDHFLRQMGGDRQGVEKIINHVHLGDLFAMPDGPSEDQGIYLGRLLKEMWEAKLSREFPGRTFNVVFDSGDDFFITFCQSF